MDNYITFNLATKLPTILQFINSFLPFFIWNCDFSGLKRNILMMMFICLLHDETFMFESLHHWLFAISRNTRALHTHVRGLTIVTWLCRLAVVTVSSEMLHANANSILTACKWAATFALRFFPLALVSITNVTMSAFAVSVHANAIDVTLFTFINLAVWSTELCGAWTVVSTTVFSAWASIHTGIGVTRWLTPWTRARARPWANTNGFFTEFSLILFWTDT